MLVSFAATPSVAFSGALVPIFRIINSIWRYMSSKKPHKALGDRLKFLRKAWALSQKDMAGSFDIATSTYQYYERGERDTPASILFTITTKGVNPAWLIAGKGEPFHKESYREEAEPSLNVKTLSIIIEMLEARLIEVKKTLDPVAKAKAVALLYEHFADTDKEVTEEKVQVYLKLVA